MNVKFLWNGIKVDGKLYKAFYSSSKGEEEEAITIYGKNYQRLPRIEGLDVKNDSDVRADYFENDRIRVLPTSPYYKDVLAALNAVNEHYEKLRMKRGR